MPIRGGKKINEGGRRSEAHLQPTLIHGHVLCLSGRRPSSAVHHFGAWALHNSERSEGRVVGEPEELKEEANIVLLRDFLRGARRMAADCRLFLSLYFCAFIFSTIVYTLARTTRILRQLLNPKL